MAKEVEMRRFVYAALGLGILFALGIGAHAGLVAMAEGDGAWAARAAASCASCHGGG